jgi:hypothetical protein
MVALLAAAGLMAAAPSTAKPRFTSLFDGKTLAGWHGDPALWSVRDKAITGAATTRLPDMTFLIRDGNWSDFELHLKYRISPGGNSGVQYRSQVTDPAKFLVGGYQANVVDAGQEARFAMLYENFGRREIGLLSEKVVIGSDGGKLTRRIGASVNRMPALLAAYRPWPQWNDYVIVAHGNRIVHAINGQLALDAVDEDPAGRKAGIFALQIDHFATPMTVQFKDIKVKPLSAAPKLDGRFKSVPGPAETTEAIPPRPVQRPR